MLQNCNLKVALFKSCNKKWQKMQQKGALFKKLQ